MSKGEPSRVSRHFTSLQARLRRLEQRYNPNNNNLHFDALSHGDADLYPAIVALAEEGLEVVRLHHAYFAKHALYADGMFWYDLFLFISAAAGRIQIDRAQAYVPTKLIDALILILARMTQYSTVNGGDITKRNHEALGNTLLVFYDENRIRALQARSKKESMSIDWTLTRVAEVREEQHKRKSAVTKRLRAQRRLKGLT
jgi:hypothetical protein